MRLIARSWAADYMSKHPGVSVYVQGGGSTTGFKAISNGSADIALASRLIRSNEAQILSKRYGKIGLSFLVAKDALSIYLNRKNPINNLTVEQVKAIFTGRVTNWREVGGINSPIQVVIRPPTSGTYNYFKEHILHNSPYVATAVAMPTTTAVTHYVATHPRAIGFGGLGYGKDVKHCRINGVPANEEQVRRNRYPLSRYLYLYTVDKSHGEIQRFIDYTLSAAGQKIVEDAGFISIWPTKP